MTMHAIDTLAAAEMLQEAGLEEKAAKAIVQVFDDGAVAHLATKDDLKDFRHEVAEKFAATHHEIAELRTVTQHEIAELRAVTEHEIAELRTSSKSDLANLESRIDTKFAQAKWQLVVAMAVLLGLFKAFDKFF